MIQVATEVFPLLDWNDFSRYQLRTKRPGRVTYDELTELVDELQKRPAISCDVVGQSYLQRDIRRIQIGEGPIRVALWSQMHGNEPTHTITLIEVLRLLTDAGNSVAATILANCSLTILPMLNPDGAVLWTRQNAQGIDINRDARRLAAPESRLLMRIIDDGNFDFAFNLHNQRPSRTVAGEHLAAVSLLVPPLDAAETETASTLRAKRLASHVRRAVEPNCEGKISRYAAGYMPRCFGETIQAKNVSTLLIEAGGCPERDADWLTQLHFFGLVSALTAIAERRVEEEDKDHYESLPKSNDQDLFDVLIRNAQLDDESSVTPHVDMAIMRELNSHGTRFDAKIAEFGDLDGSFGRQFIDGSGLAMQPGRVVFDGKLTPSCEQLETSLQAAARLGVTTVVGVVPLGDAKHLSALSELKTNAELPINVGWIGLLSAVDQQYVPVIAGKLEPSIRRHLLAIIDNGQRLESVGNLLDLRIVTSEQLAPFALETAAELATSSNASVEFGRLIGWLQAGKIELGGLADVILFDPQQPHAPTHVIVQGNLVVRDGQPTYCNAGRVIELNS